MSSSSLLPSVTTSALPWQSKAAQGVLDSAGAGITGGSQHETIIRALANSLLGRYTSLVDTEPVRKIQFRYGELP
jgi:hypothetical protein